MKDSASMEEEAIFDPSLMKKKKKKKTAFDLDSAMAAEAEEESTLGSAPAEDSNKAADDLDDDLDLEDFGKKKKKKKKKPFNEADLEGQLDGEGGEDQNEAADKPEDDLDLDFASSKKKKRSKKKDLNEILDQGDELKDDDKENAKDTSTAWSGTDRDYTYDELLKRVFDIILEKNPEMAAGTKPKFIIKPPQVLKIGTKKTSFANFTEICKTLHRQPKHLLDFLLAELGTSGSVDGNSQLIIKGRFQPKQIENVLRRYIKEYVTCHTCRSPETILQKDTRLFFLQCETCGSRCSVASIKSGFQAVTGKRAAIRAKTA